MNQAFGDTSFFVALISLKDAHHELADRLGREYEGRVVTTQWVLLEVANFFAASHRRSTAIQFLHSLMNDSQTKIDSATAQSFRDGWDLYQSRHDKSWSLTDCISVNTMRAGRLRQALSSDHHFEQAGFEILLK
jgi:predicted nucleic acid-binding protein